MCSVTDTQTLSPNIYFDLISNVDETTDMDMRTKGIKCRVNTNICERCDFILTPNDMKMKSFFKFGKAQGTKSTIKMVYMYLANSLEWRSVVASMR